MKLWRLRKKGALNSVQLGGSGHPWLTSTNEVARIEACTASPQSDVKPRGSTLTARVAARETEAA